MNLPQIKTLFFNASIGTGASPSIRQMSIPPLYNCRWEFWCSGNEPPAGISTISIQTDTSYPHVVIASFNMVDANQFGIVNPPLTDFCRQIRLDLYSGATQAVSYRLLITGLYYPEQDIGKFNLVI